MVAVADRLHVAAFYGIRRARRSHRVIVRSHPQYDRSALAYVLCGDFGDRPWRHRDRDSLEPASFGPGRTAHPRHHDRHRKSTQIHRRRKLRKETDNPTAYGGPEIARQQRESYSGIMPLKLRSTPRRTFDRALEIARDMGWEITAESRRQGWIEATDTTFWFGFKDDIVIRITGERSGITRIDLRSASRLGDSDLGINAKRVQTFLERLAAKAR